MISHVSLYLMLMSLLAPCILSCRVRTLDTSNLVVLSPDPLMTFPKAPVQERFCSSESETSPPLRLAFYNRAGGLGSQINEK